MSEFTVEKQPWRHWPRVLVVHKTGTNAEERRYLPERTCEVVGFDDGIDEGADGEWYAYSDGTWYLSCGHEASGSERPNYCPECGARVLGEDE
jgi:hypothetical protein